MGLPPQQVSTSQAPPSSLPPGLHQIHQTTSLPQQQPPMQQPSQVPGPMPNPPPGLGMPMANMPPGMSQSMPPTQAMPGGPIPTHSVMSAPNLALSSQNMTVPPMQTTSHPSVSVVNAMSTQHMPGVMPQPQFQTIMPPQQQQQTQPKPDTSNPIAELISFD